MQLQSAILGSCSLWCQWPHITKALEHKNAVEWPISGKAIQKQDLLIFLIIAFKLWNFFKCIPRNQINHKIFLEHQKYIPMTLNLQIWDRKQTMIFEQFVLSFFTWKLERKHKIIAYNFLQLNQGWTTVLFNSYLTKEDLIPHVRK